MIKKKVSFIIFGVVTLLLIAATKMAMPVENWEVVEHLPLTYYPEFGEERYAEILENDGFKLLAVCQEPNLPRPPIGQACDRDGNMFICGHPGDYQTLIRLQILQTPTPTATATLTNTPTATFTPTATATFTPTFTSTSTNTPTSTSTNTPVPPTKTPKPKPSKTPVPTNTKVPPTPISTGVIGGAPDFMSPDVILPAVVCGGAIFIMLIVFLIGTILRGKKKK